MSQVINYLFNVDCLVHFWSNEYFNYYVTYMYLPISVSIEIACVFVYIKSIFVHVVFNLIIEVVRDKLNN